MLPFMSLKTHRRASATASSCDVFIGGPSSMGDDHVIQCGIGSVIGYPEEQLQIHHIVVNYLESIRRRRQLKITFRKICIEKASKTTNTAATYAIVYRK